ncbi:gliding motility-associated C-terminal domain-containing protein [Hymenobacter sp. J193]|uniref:gliding motility-associated C-terminal domain-containing protein n=1 Tax=Hymenobacter sp. J193 TaxID=2898429 RepID=UPI002151931D|nr:gliding motility-associated C-terminal domain-containing protein [Hymenobacter sp. J193]MCR5886776.1 gliding motility-associated C-terminal domain-containing protein [Hymenobacter sp. J193]
MTQLVLPDQLRRLWAVVLVLLAALSARPAQATHLRAGDIQVTADTTANPIPGRYFFKLVTYAVTDAKANDDDRETIFFGDGTSSGLDAIVRESTTPLGNNVSRNVYRFSHIYNAPGPYTIHYIGENRNPSIRNINGGSSANINIYLYAKIIIDPALKGNRSPVLSAPPIDLAAVRQVYLHNPAGSDADGDSLAYKLVECRYVPGGVASVRGNTPEPKVVPAYRYPDDQASTVSPGGVQVPFAGPPAAQEGRPAIFTQDVLTGQIVWNSPSMAGEFNVAFVVEEWRRVEGATPVKIGEILRDMQITVSPTDNLRPILTLPRDICIIAGDSARGVVRAVDPNGDPIDLTAFGGLLARTPVLTPPGYERFRATFRQKQRTAPVSGVFRWRSTCADVAEQPYQIVFRASDDPGNNEVPLIDQGVWRITVVGPPPENLQATPEALGINLTWNLYECQNASRILIYRREGPGNFEPDTCNPGIPTSAGYVQIGEVAANTREFRDDNKGRGLERGKTFCYRIYAEFPLPAGGKSLASQEVCAKIEGRPILLTNVTVERTGVTDGSIKVVWTKPVLASGAFFTPSGYRLYRSEGINSTPTVLVTAPIRNLNDTVYVDSNLNTQEKAFTYRVEFFSSKIQGGTDEIVEAPPAASSVRLEGTPTAVSDGINLTWQYQVPWDNTVRPTRIYRRDQGATTYTLITTVPGGATSGTYLDKGTATAPLRKNQEYCYYVETDGEYKTPPIGPLLNKSQEKCVVLASVPCPPVLTLVETNCDSLAALPYFPNITSTPYNNKLTWTLDENNPADCSTEIAYYRIYFSATQSQNLADFTLLDSTTVRSFVHRNLTSPAGCYYVVSVDKNERTSTPSNIACHDACLFFVLPNIFTPNGDRINDTFRPKVASPIRRTKFTVFNRWGRKVYESDKNPLIEWNGTDKVVSEGLNTPSSKVVDGVYYYLAEVEFADFAGTKKTYKGWVEITR